MLGDFFFHAQSYIFEGLNLLFIHEHISGEGVALFVNFLLNAPKFKLELLVLIGSSFQFSQAVLILLLQLLFLRLNHRVQPLLVLCRYVSFNWTRFLLPLLNLAIQFRHLVIMLMHHWCLLALESLRLLSHFLGHSGYSFFQFLCEHVVEPTIHSLVLLLPFYQFFLHFLYLVSIPFGLLFILYLCRNDLFSTHDPSFLTFPLRLLQRLGTIFKHLLHVLDSSLIWLEDTLKLFISGLVFSDFALSLTSFEEKLLCFFLVLFLENI